MRKRLAALTAVGAVVLGGGVVGASNTNPPDPLFGTGPSGSGPSVPDCPVGQFVTLDQSTDTFVCAIETTPVPPGAVALATDAACPVPGDLEVAGADPDGDGPQEAPKTFTDPTQMKTLLECILPLAVEWMTWEYGSLTPPPEWQSESGTLLPLNFYYVPTGVTGGGDSWADEHCVYDDTSEQYCPSDGNIYLGEQQIWADYNDHGDADVYGTISHEMGHRIQQVANAHNPNPDVPNEEIPSENMADCFSGAFLVYAERQGYIDAVASGDDLIDLFVGLFEIGDVLGAEQTHGTIDQRIRAFFVGYNAPTRGVWDCDFYYTDGVTIVPLDSPDTAVGQTPVTTSSPTTVPVPTTTQSVIPAGQPGGPTTVADLGKG